MNFYNETLVTFTSTEKWILVQFNWDLNKCSFLVKRAKKRGSSVIFLKKWKNRAKIKHLFMQVEKNKQSFYKKSYIKKRLNDFLMISGIK